MYLMPTAKIQPPAFLPARHRDLIAGKRITGKVPRGARLRVRTPENIGTAEWNMKHRIMPRSEAHEGNWRNEFTPHAPQIWEEYDKPYVSELYYCGPERDGKTNIMLGCLGRSQDCAPGNFFYMMPNETKAGQIFTQKLKPMFELSQRLRKLLTGKVNDFTKDLISLSNGVYGFPAHATSAASLASFSGKYLFGDEIDKNDRTVGSETDSVTLLLKRKRDQPEGKAFLASTPAGKFIYKLASQCVRVYRWEMPCPHCHEYFIASEEGMVVPDGATEETLKNGVHVATQSCQANGCELTEREFNTARRAARKVAVKGAAIARPESVGFLRTAWDCYLIQLKEIAIAKVKAENGDLAEKRDYAHGYKCENYEETIVGASDTAQILRHKSDLPRNAIPLGTAMLIMLADTQQDHFYYQIHSLGYAPNLDMHLVRHGIVQKFSDLEYILNDETFEDADGKEYRIQCGLIDSGGTRKRYQKHSRTVQVYDWCLTQPKMSPFKGVWSRRDGSMIAYKPVETYPGTNKRIPGGLVRVDAKVDYFKDELTRRLSIEPDDPGAISFHSDIDEGFAKHYCAEGKNETGEWEHDTKKGRNDYFDCHVYAFVLREILKTRIPVAPGAANSKSEGKPKPKKQKERRW